jgi:hypothetical protein
LVWWKNPCPCLRSRNELPTEARYWQCSLIRWRLAKSGVFLNWLCTAGWPSSL